MQAMDVITRWDVANLWKPKVEQHWCNNCTPRARTMVAMYENAIITLNQEMKDVMKLAGMEHPWDREDENRNEDVPIRTAIDYMRECEKEFEQKKNKLEEELKTFEAKYLSEKQEDENIINQLKLELKNIKNSLKRSEICIERLKARVEECENEIIMLNKEKETYESRCGNQKYFFHALDDKRTEEQEEIATLQKENQQLKEIIETLENKIALDEESEAEDDVPEAPKTEIFPAPEDTAASSTMTFSFFSPLYISMLYWLTFFTHFIRLVVNTDSIPDLGVQEQKTLEIENDKDNQEESLDAQDSFDGDDDEIQNSEDYIPQPIIGRRTYRNSVKAAKKLMRQRRSEEQARAQELPAEIAPIKTTNYIHCFMKYFIILVISLALATHCLPGASSLEIGDDTDIVRDTFPSLSLLEQFQ